MIGILGQKLGMTRLLREDGTIIPVTLVKTAKNLITRVKTEGKDGYNALVLGVNKAKSEQDLAISREFKITNPDEFKDQKEINLSIFTEGETVSIQGISKGKGFQGVIKRHKFHRGPMTHGSDHHREPGSVGTRKPRRIKPGKKLPGHMGLRQISLKKVQIIKIDPERQIIALKGPLPGSISSFIKITKEA